MASVPGGRLNGVVTILFTDLVGSTEILGRLGEDQTDDLRRAHFTMLRSALSRHGGDEVKTIGDSVMAAFTSPARAIACAIEMQQHVHTNARPGGIPLAIRIGVNAGEVAEEDGDYFGTPVVIARRLCDLAGGGQIFVSDVVRALVGSRGGFSFKELGALPLKGIDDPVAAFGVAWEPLDEGIPLPDAIDADRTILIGREPEREALGRAFVSARDGDLALALIAGEPGIGKTSLAFDMAREAHTRGATVLYGRCEEELAAAYQPFAEALDQLARHSSDALTGIDVSRLVPGFAEDSTETQTDPESERHRLFEAVGAVLARVAADAPMVLVLDDLHWADKPTLLLLRHVVRTARPARVLIVGTYRDVELDRTHPFAEMLADLRREPGYERILLRGLSIDGVAAYLEGRAGHQLDTNGRTFAAALHRETEGNPFFIREIIRHLAESGALYEREGRWTSDRSIEDVGLPESIREVIGRRLNRLGDECGEVLAIASVIGRDFDLSVLARVSERDEDRLADLLDQAVNARGVIAEVPGVIDRYSFAHALVRETLYEELTTSRLVRLHRRIGEAIEQIYARDLDPHLTELAHHFQEASVTGVELKAIEYSRRAAAHAVQQLAFEEAAQHIERALHTLDELGDTDPGMLCETLIAAAEIQQRMASLNEARRFGARAAEIARRHQWPERFARAALGFGGLWVDVGLVNDELVSLLREAIESLPDDHPMLPLLEGRLAMDLFSGDPAELDAHSLRAVEVARRGSDPGVLAYALVARRHAVSGPARLDERLAITSEAIELAREVGDANLEMRARAFRIADLTESADKEARDTELEDFFRLAEEYRQPFYLLYMVRFLHESRAIMEGRFEEADEILTPLIALTRQQGRITAITATATQKMQLHFFRGQQTPQETAEIVIRTGETVLWGWATNAWVLYQAGRREEARIEWGRVTAEEIRRLGDHWGTLFTLRLAAEMAYAFGDRATVSALYDRLLPFSGRNVPMAATALVSVLECVDDGLGLCAEMMGELDEATRRYEMASALHEKWRMRPFHCTTRMRLARALVARAGPGDVERARELLDAALEEAAEIGLGVELVEESRALRSRI